MRLTEEEKQNLKEKLDYIGLDLEKIPEFLKKYEPVDFRISSTYKESEYKIYQFVNIEDIQIMITPTTRLDDIKLRYESAKPFSNYILYHEDNQENYEEFLSMLQEVEIEEIKQIEKEQKILKEKIPFRVKYKDNFIWQIFYSETSHQYFMLVPSEDLEFAPLFYLLKKQIESKRNQNGTKEKIYVPINGISYSLDFLGFSEIEQLHDYLWLFTKDWPNIYEVTEQNGDKTMQIVGTTKVYENMTSQYKVILHDAEEASKFFRLVKALFLLQTELNSYYHYTVQINDKSELEFWDNHTKIEYDFLAAYLMNQYKIKCELIRQKRIEEKKIEEALQKQRKLVKEKESEYLVKQKEISTFLECRKTFLGKVKYYFKAKKKEKEVEQECIEEKVQENSNNLQMEIGEKKDLYTIADLISIHKELTKRLNHIKNMEVDKKGIENRIELLENKIKNASKYIENIENHKKSIFEFWKFANKDNRLTLTEGQKQAEQTHIKKVFDYEMDREEFAKKVDKIQRNKLQKEEQDAVFLAHTDLLKALNEVKKETPNLELLQEILEKIKKQIEEERMGRTLEEYDLFGNITADQTKLKQLSNHKHRETEKSKLRLINVTNPMQVEEFKQKLQEVELKLQLSFQKMHAIIDMPLFQFREGNVGIQRTGYDHYSINVQNAFETVVDKQKEKINLYKIYLQEGMPAIYYSNSMFYDNKNLTLPLGMDVTEEVLINADLFEFHLVKQGQFKINQVSEEQEDAAQIQVKTVNVYEYQLIEKNLPKEGEEKN